MEAFRPSSPPDIWVRLARLDRTCEIQVTKVSQGSGWQVVVSKRDNKGESSIRVVGLTMGEALTIALQHAEAQNWHLAS